jgi:glycosyltransferase involved in cell wall biosynthesis
MSKIEFIIPTYDRTKDLTTIVSSIVAQTNPNWSIHIVSDNSPQEVQEQFLDLLAFFDAYKDQIKISVLNERYNDWGHTPRNYGLQEAKEEWVVMTGEDNYYAPTFVENFLDAVKDRDDVNFVFCNFVLNGKNDEYVPVRSEIEFGKIDIGCYITRTFNAQKLKLKTDIAEADYWFVEEYLARFVEAQIIHIDKILYVHN